MGDNDIGDGTSAAVGFHMTTGEIQISEEDLGKLRNVENMSSDEIAAIFGNGLRLKLAQDLASIPPKAEGGGSSKKGGGKAQAHTLILVHKQGPSNIPTITLEEGIAELRKGAHL